jgi:lysyl endopeptidase
MLSIRIWLVWTLALPAIAGAERASPYVPVSAVAPPAVAAPGLAQRVAAQPAAVRLAASRQAERAKRETLAQHNRSGSPLLQDGFVRSLPQPLPVALTSELEWALKLEIEDAHRVRLRLDRVLLPPGARLWIEGASGESVGPFGLELLDEEGGLWTPSVAGPWAVLSLELPTSSGPAPAWGFGVETVLEVVDLDGEGGADKADARCLVDGRCVTPADFGPIEAYRAAIAQLRFVRDGVSLRCTGGLLSDTSRSGTPYLLTANHCFSSQAAASSLEAFWDYHPERCGGPAPSLDSRPRSNGSTLLATGVQSDFTFVRLATIPSGRAFLGWDADASAVAEGTSLYQLSHPAPNRVTFQQAFSTSVATFAPGPGLCGTDGAGRPWGDLTKFLYSQPVDGATFGGSSGAPIALAGGFVVGQLLGVCGSNLGEPCLGRSSYSQVDGRFSATYPSLARWLSPGASSGPCVPDAATLCIDDQPGDRRFRVEVDFATSTANGRAQAVPLGNLGIQQGGIFWFFSPGNPELLIKVLNACTLNNRYWIFFAGTTNVQLSVTVTDTVTGNLWTRTNPNGRPLPTVQDTSALACP